ncbi:MAG: hypothetical protein V1782_12055, partial [Pseudomonadota bacterium]
PRDYNLIDWSDCSGTVVVFIPEWWSLSLRNGGRFQPGMVVVFGRNTHLCFGVLKTRLPYQLNYAKNV